MIKPTGNMKNVEIMSDGAIRPRKGYATFAGMVHQLWLINRRYRKLGVSGNFTVRLPLRPGKYRKS